MKKVNKKIILTFLIIIIFALTNGYFKSKINKKDQKLVFNLSKKIDTIDPTITTQLSSSNIIVNIFQGLTKFGKDNKIVLGMAEKIDVSQDGLVYNFKIKENAKWSDGKPVRAQDFEYSWFRGLDKNIGSDYHDKLFYIDNARDFYNDKVIKEEVGIKVLNDKELQVTLEHPTPYFLELLTIPIYMPLREDIVSEDKNWTLYSDSCISNGPFKLEKIDIGSEVVIVKNKYYYDNKKVNLEEITFKLMADTDISVNNLKNGVYDIINSVPKKNISQITEENSNNEVVLNSSLGTFFLAVNTGNNSNNDKEAKQFLSNKKVRQALSMAIDRQDIIDNIIGENGTPAYGYVPKGVLRPDGSEFANKQYIDVSKVNQDKAIELLREAGYGEGLKEIPYIDIISNYRLQDKAVVEKIKNDLYMIGVPVNVIDDEKELSIARKNGNFDIARRNWIGDYNDPMTFLNLFISNSPTNTTGFSNKEFDKLIHDSEHEVNVNIRMNLLKKAEDILMDEIPLIPIYFHNNVKAKRKDLKDVLFTNLGKVIFENAYID